MRILQIEKDFYWDSREKIVCTSESVFIDYFNVLHILFDIFKEISPNVWLKCDSESWTDISVVFFTEIKMTEILFGLFSVIF